jgi:D-3-phosphoglycerate dehydrogenase
MVQQLLDSPDGYTNIEQHPKSLPETKLAAPLRDAYIIGIRSATQLTAQTFAHAPGLIGSGCFCIGTNQVDPDAATDLGNPGVPLASA